MKNSFSEKLFNCYNVNPHKNFLDNIQHNITLNSNDENFKRIVLDFLIFGCFCYKKSNDKIEHINIDKKGDKDVNFYDGGDPFYYSKSFVKNINKLKELPNLLEDVIITKTENLGIHITTSNDEFEKIKNKISNDIKNENDVFKELSKDSIYIQNLNECYGLSKDFKHDLSIDYYRILLNFSLPLKEKIINIYNSL